jgi:hypothetical protein
MAMFMRPTRMAIGSRNRNQPRCSGSTSTPSSMPKSRSRRASTRPSIDQSTEVIIATSFKGRSFSSTRRLIRSDSDQLRVIISYRIVWRVGFSGRGLSSGHALRSGEIAQSPEQARQAEIHLAAAGETGFRLFKAHDAFDAAGKEGVRIRRAFAVIIHENQ